jgi:hypothetical protein
MAERRRLWAGYFERVRLQKLGDGREDVVPTTVAVGRDLITKISLNAVTARRRRSSSR